MDKIELHQLCGYLPFGLKWDLQGLKQFTMSGLTAETLYTEEGTVLVWPKHPDLPQALFPILRPLSDYGGINSPAMNDLNCDISTQIAILELASKIIGLSGLSYTDAQLCYRSHIDIHELIPAGLAIDQNTLNTK